MKTLDKKQIVESLKKDMGVKNEMALPRLKKATLNVGIGSYVRNNGDKGYDTVTENIGLITGQKPVVTKARMAISNFKLREGQPVGVTVTLRGERMMDLMMRLVHVVLPRIRDFRGISVKGFDGQGNYSLGIKEITVFPEVNPENLSHNHGVQITVNTSAKNDHEGYLLLKALGFPFKEEGVTSK